MIILDLDKLGETVKTERTLFKESELKKYTLKEAIEYAKQGRRYRRYNVHIDENDYEELITMYTIYHNSVEGDLACKKLNMRFFDPSDKERYTMQEFTDRMKKYGWNFESPHKAKFTEQKVAKKAMYKASLPNN